jgi:mono/diheme cytochrome c family protein
MRSTLATLLLSAGNALAQGDAPSYAAVSSVLRQHCVVCHQGEAAPLGLRLGTFDELMRGSARGPVVRARDPAASEIVRRIRGISQPRMPLTGPPWLSEPQISLIERWIAAGAPQGDATAAPARKPARPADGAVTYADVAPILVGRCAKCHSANGIMGRPPEGYRLDSLQATLDASDRARVVPGNPDASELVRRIRGQSLPRMPFDGPPYLNESEIKLIERWIARGAPDAAGRVASVPVGARVRFRGAEEVRGIVNPDGSIRITRQRPR